MNIIAILIIALSLSLNIFLFAILAAAKEDRNYYKEANSRSTDFNLQLLDRINFLKRNLSMLRASLNKLNHKPKERD